MDESRAHFINSTRRKEIMCQNYTQEKFSMLVNNVLLYFQSWLFKPFDWDPLLKDFLP